MPTLLQINVDANNGSNGSIARDIGSIALAKGWKSYLAYGRRAIPSDSELIRIGNNVDIGIHGVISRLFDLHGLGSIISTFFFLRKVKRIKPDIVHLHNIHGYFINYRMLFNYLDKEKIPIVWTFHDCWPFTGHCGHFIGFNCYRWQKKCGKCPAKKSYPASFFLDNSANNYSLKKRLFTSLPTIHVVTVSNWLKSVVEQSFFKKYDITTIYDGIDIDSFKYTESNLKEELGVLGKYVLVAAAANWSKSKGWDDYLAISKVLPDNYVIILIGVNPSQIANLPSNIIGIPHVEGREKLAEYYSIADILLNLSYAETFGMTTAEAMACGTPGISYNITACPELLTPETGIVVEPGNIQQVLNAIEQIIRKGKDSYRTACRQRVIDNYNFKIINQKYFDIYNIILSSR